MARTWTVVAGAATAGLVASAGLAAVAGPWEDGQRTAERTTAASAERAAHPPAPGRRATTPPRARPAPEVLAGSMPSGSTGHSRAADDPSAPPAPSAAHLKSVLGPLLGAPELGSRVSAAVLDAATGRALFTRAGGRAATPASTTKIATAVAVLSTAGPEHRIATRAVRDSAESDTVTLIGGGDPTLTAEARAPRAGSSSAEQSGLSEHAEHPASLSALAAAAARELKRSGTTSITLNYDLSAYTGPRLHRIGQDENLAETVSLMADEGRVNPRSTEQAPRHPDPAAVAAKKFAELLEKQGITVRGTPKERTAPKRPAALAVVRSQPVSQLVERMLTDSDNDLGEALARQTAIATGAEPSFDGAGTAVRRALKKAGIDTTGCLLHDGSGLDRRNRLSADALTGLLAMAAAPEHPELRPVLTGLPVAGFTGTLGGRYRGAGTSGGAGLVRAKTGSLTGVNTLSGTATTSRGRLLLFAFLTDDSADATRARRALDRAAAALTG